MLIPTNIGRLSTRRLLWTWIAAKSSSKILARANAGLAMRCLFVLLMQTHQLHINPLPQVLHGLPEDRVVHELVQVLLEVACSPFLELCIHPDVWLHPRALVEPEGTMDRSQTQAQKYSCRFR